MFELLLLALLGLHLLANFFGERFDVDLFEQFLDALGAHHGNEPTGEFLVELPFALVGDDFTAAQPGIVARLHDDVGFEVEDALEFAQSNVEEVPDAAGQSLEEPYVRTRAGQFDMSQAFPADARQRNFHAALIANHAAVLHALILAA